jgi:MinD-like ATPase involved in chromosome partitioning or flagellar assembly
MRGQQAVPVVALVGTRGGVGKSTIAQYFAEMVLSSPGEDGNVPNVLLIDLDVHSRQITQHYTPRALMTCPTVHELVQQDLPPAFQPMNVTAQVRTIGKVLARRGELYMIPSASSEDDDVYKVAANKPADQMVQLLTHLIQGVVDNHQIACVVLDCTAHIDTYAAAATAMADAILCVSLVEPGCFERSKEQGRRIRAQVPSFDPQRVKLILNKYSNTKRLQQLGDVDQYYHAIPFSEEVIDTQDWPGESIDEFRLAIFADYVGQLIEKVLKPRWPWLVPPPSVLVPPLFAYLARVAPKLPRATRMKWLAAAQYLMWIGIIVAIVGVGGLYEAGRLSESPTSASGQPAPHLPNDFLGFTRTQLSNCGLGLLALGTFFVGCGWWARIYRRDLRQAIDELIQGREIWVMRQVEKGRGQQAKIHRLLRLARSLPDFAAFVQEPH